MNFCFFSVIRDLSHQDNNRSVYLVLYFNLAFREGLNQITLILFLQAFCRLSGNRIRRKTEGVLDGEYEISQFHLNNKIITCLYFMFKNSKLAVFYCR